MGLSGGKSKSSSSFNQVTQSQPLAPSWISSPAQNYVSQVSGLLNTPATNFTTPATALQRKAWDRAGVGVDSSVYDEGVNAIRGLLNYQPTNVEAGQLTTTDLNPYLNPYQGEVINGLLGDFAQGNATGLNQLRGATPTGAFNGSRAGVAEGTLTGDNLRTLATTLGNLRSQGYQNAQNAALADIQNRIGVDTGNADRGLSAAGLRLNAGNADVAAGLAGAANTRADTQQMADLGGEERAINSENNPYVALLSLLQSGQGLLGYNPGQFIGQKSNSSGTSTSTQSQDSGLLGGLGSLLGGLGAIGFNPFAVKTK